jgi:arylsulfatase A-like enzyme
MSRTPRGLALVVADLRPAAILLVAALGCARDAGPRAERVVVHRLADELAAGRGAREAPAAAVGDVTRPTLVALPAVPMSLADASPSVQVTAEGTAEIALDCPEAAAGRRLVVWVVPRLLVGKDEAGKPRWAGSGTPHAEEVRCPTGDPATLRLHVGGLEPGTTAWPTVTGYWPGAGRAKTGWLALAPHSTLRFAIGIASPGRPEDAAPASFVLRAESRDGHAVELLRRTLDPARRLADRGWVEVEVPLDDARARLGGEVRLVFVARPAVAGALAFPAWGNPTITAPAATPRARRRNVVLVSLDALRPDRLGCYGFPYPTSPNLDRLAAEGTLFERAITPANWTLPSHATMLAGVLPCVHEFGGGRKAGFRPLPDGVTPLAEVLRREGYATAAFTENAYVDPSVFARGFDVFRANTTMAGGGPAGLVEDTLASAGAWLRAHAEGEVFLFVHTYQVHQPYEPPARYRELVRADGVPWPAGRLAPSARWAEAAAAYAAEVRYTDDALAALLRLLDELGLGERTILVVTSDHGEAFGEHGRDTHGFTLFEEEVRVPLIWHAPGLVAAGRRITALVGLVDVAPTVLDLLGLAVPAWMQGVSLGPLMEVGSDPAAAPPDRVLPIESLVGLRGVHAGAWKGLVRDGRVVVYDLDRDPTERTPERSPRWDGVVRDAQARLDADCARVRALVSAAPAGDAARPAPAVRDLERERKLRALGYVE